MQELGFGLTRPMVAEVVTDYVPGLNMQTKPFPWRCTRQGLVDPVSQDMAPALCEKARPSLQEESRGCHAESCGSLD